MMRRSSKACEQCRKIKRRCQPPFPCNNCLSKGFACQVRERARPGRVRHRTGANTEGTVPQPAASAAAAAPSNTLLDTSTSPSRDTHYFATALQDFNPDGQAGSSRSPSVYNLKDPGQVLYDITSEYARSSFGFELTWSLKEPKQSIFPAALPPRATRAQDYLVMLGDTANIQVRLSVLNNQLGVQPKFVDTARMLAVARSLHEAITRAANSSSISPTNPASSASPTDEMSLSSLLLTSDEANSDVPLDTASFFFGALALGSCYNFQDLRETNWLFSEATDLSSAYTGPPTLDLLGAQFLQHHFLLGTGSANQAKAMIVQALHTANHVGFGGGQGGGKEVERGNGGQRALIAYLMVNFADQYCAMDHGTAPIIRSQSVDYSIFDSLVEKDPQAWQFVKLLKLNGMTLESLYNQKKMTVKEVMTLEATIGEAWLDITTKTRVGSQRSYSSSMSVFPQLIRIQMFWCRIMIRAPLLEFPSSWITSISICSRAAHMILSLYLDIFKPEIMPWVNDQQNPNRPTSSNNGPSQILMIDYKIPSTWRQVKRIAISALVIALAHGRGEIPPEEASALLSTGLLLLHCQRTRWQRDLQGLIQGVLGLMEMGCLDAKGSLAGLLPDADEPALSALTSWSWETIHVIYRPSSAEEEAVFGDQMGGFFGAGGPGLI